jgi:DNA recombination protein RmuC
MEFLNYILLFLLGLSLGGLIAWLVAKSRIGQRLTQIISQRSAEIARLEEVIHGTERELQDRNTRLSDLQAKLNQAEASILKISEERSAANAKLEHMHEIEQALEEKTSEIKALNATLTGLKEKHAALETVIEKERMATEEKLQLLEKARAELTDTFQAISARALKNSHASFLELAKATLGKYQEGASRDLELRQKEVKQIVEPVRESLANFDKQVQEM